VRERKKSLSGREQMLLRGASGMEQASWQHWEETELRARGRWSVSRRPQNVMTWATDTARVICRPHVWLMTYDTCLPSSTLPPPAQRDHRHFTATHLYYQSTPASAPSTPTATPVSSLYTYLSAARETSCAGGRHNMPRPLQVHLWPFELENGVRVTCDVGYLCANCQF